MGFDLDIDAMGLLCPLPVLKLRKGLAGIDTGQIARLRCSDPATVIDVPHFCTEHGHELHHHQSQNGVEVFYIQKRS